MNALDAEEFLDLTAESQDPEGISEGLDIQQHPIPTQQPQQQRTDLDEDFINEAGAAVISLLDSPEQSKQCQLRQQEGPSQGQRCVLCVLGCGQWVPTDELESHELQHALSEAPENTSTGGDGDDEWAVLGLQEVRLG
jgi:hypothetical protein